MIKLALCLYGFNRQSVLTKDIYTLIKNKWFSNNELSITVFYSTYNTEFEFSDVKLNKDKLLKSFYKFGLNDVHLICSDYNENEFLQEIKNTGIGKTNVIPTIHFHRALSLYRHMSKSVKCVDNSFDYIMISRLNYGIDSITYKDFDIVNKWKVNHICGLYKPLKGFHVHGSFFFGTCNDMYCFKTLDENFLQNIEKYSTYNLHEQMAIFVKDKNKTHVLISELISFYGVSSGSEAKKQNIDYYVKQKFNKHFDDVFKSL